MKKIRSLIVVFLFFSFSLSTIMVPYVLGAEDSWTSKAPMQEARAGLGVAVVNGKVYAVGGYNSQVDGETHFYGTINATEEYDPATDSWTEKAQMPTPRAGFATAVYENRVYVIGGYLKLTSGSSSQLTDITEVYDPASDTWETRASMPAARDGAEANVVDGKIYVIGGYDENGDPSNLNMAYDPETDSWTTKEPIPTAVGDYASAMVDNRIYVMSGRSGDDVTVLTQIYDPETDMWSIGASIPTGVSGAAAGATTGATAQKAIYVIGGKSASEPLYAQTLVQVYSPENNSWSLGASLPAARAELGVAAVNDTLYAIGGGRSILQAASADVWQYTPIGDIPEFPSWIILPLLLTAALVAVLCKQRLPKNR